MKQFLKKVQLINGGYLSNGEKKPVFNAAFVKAQQHAEYVVKFAELAKGKDFKGKEADSVDSLKQEVLEYFNKSKTVAFVEKPEKVKQPTTDKLAKEALAFIEFTENSSKTDKINSFLQQFKVLSEFEEFGLFFEEDIVKLDKLYTMKEVITAVTETIDLLD